MNARSERTHRGRAAALVLAISTLLALAGVVASPARAATDPAPTAKAAILVESSTGKVVFRRKADERRAIASATKIMTALVVRANTRLDDEIEIPAYNGAAVESVAGLQPGDRMTVAELLEALLLESGNDAAAALAKGVSGSEEAFVRLMNRRAEELGLKDTHFANPVGLDETGNYSTAADLAVMAEELRRDRFLRKTVALPSAELTSGSTTIVVENRNTLVDRYPWINGVKTGHTQEAGYVLVGSGTRRGVTMVSVVLGEPSESGRESNTVSLLRYGLDRWRLARPVKRGEPLKTVSVQYQPDESATLIAGRGFRRAVPKKAKLRVIARAPDELTGPIPQGTRVGTIEIRQGRRVLGRVPLVTASSVPKATTLERVQAIVPVPLIVVVVALAVVGSLLLIVGLRHRRGRRRGPETPARTQSA
jgi:D-alanyl-D-alanine carboxypeptidase (penicillin-binding protein 5/6)